MMWASRTGPSASAPRPRRRPPRLPRAAPGPARRRHGRAAAACGRSWAARRSPGRPARAKCWKRSAAASIEPFVTITCSGSIPCRPAIHSPRPGVRSRCRRRARAASRRTAPGGCLRTASAGRMSALGAPRAKLMVSVAGIERPSIGALSAGGRRQRALPADPPAVGQLGPRADQGRAPAEGAPSVAVPERLAVVGPQQASATKNWRGGSRAVPALERRPEPPDAPVRLTRWRLSTSRSAGFVRQLAPRTSAGGRGAPRAGCARQRSSGCCGRCGAGTGPRAGRRARRRPRRTRPTRSAGCGPPRTGSVSIRSSRPRSTHGGWAGRSSVRPSSGRVAVAPLTSTTVAARSALIVRSRTVPPAGMPGPRSRSGTCSRARRPSSCRPGSGAHP